MSISKSDLDAFHQFAEAKLATHEAQSLQELVDFWEIEHPSPELHAENVAAVRAAIRDMETGDARRPAGKIIEELRNELAR